MQTYRVSSETSSSKAHVCRQARWTSSLSQSSTPYWAQVLPSSGNHAQTPGERRPVKPGRPMLSSQS